MNFTKAELQTIRTMVSKELGVLERIIQISDSQRKEFFELSDKEDPETQETYHFAKQISNFNKTIRKQRVEKIALLRKIKEQIQIADGKIPKSHLHMKNKFFSWVRGE